MIDLTKERPLPLAAALPWIPPARGGEPTPFSTLLRWGLYGWATPDGRRVRLEAVRLGHRWMTSHDALQRLAQRLTPPLEAVAGPGKDGAA